MSNPNPSASGWTIGGIHLPVDALQRLGVNVEAGPKARWNRYLTQGQFAWLVLRDSPRTATPPNP